MRRRLLLLAVPLAAAAALAAATAAARQSSTPTIVGTDGPGYSIKLTKNGTAVKTLKAGTYKLVIHDKSNFHGWSQDGPVEKDFSPIGFVGTKTFTVKLKKGSYKFYCPNHETQMFGHFKVT